MTMDAGTNKLSMAELTRTAAERYGDAVAARFLRDGEWAELTFNELWDRVRDLALGLIELGVGVGDRVAILANTRVEFTARRPRRVDRRGDRRAGLPVELAGRVRVGRRQLRRPVIICEDAAQVAKIDQVRAGLPDLEHVVIIDGDGGRRDVDGRAWRRGARRATPPSSNGGRPRSAPTTPA